MTWSTATRVPARVPPRAERRPPAPNTTERADEELSDVREWVYDTVPPAPPRQR